MFRKILIANRGEIAVRILRACKELGIQSVAVYSDADRNALHAQIADEAVYIGASEPRESYLNTARVIDAAKRSGAEAIHPGYGFLSENAEFAQQVEDSRIVFIGPRPNAIRAMGNKAQARQQLQAHVPVIPGYHDKGDDRQLRQASDELGYPVLVKAAAGGGGKGMRVVLSAPELETELAAARREAMNAFGDPRIILERFIPNARHIEFQILADRHGAIIHLFERECSIQRRYQKVIEETPSPLLDSELRERMGTAAINAARAVGYENAGTVEFIVDPATREFYFLEMNTRLQVEHPITEATTGIDLVQWQIRIAAGERLKDMQYTQRGHAIECRVYAEDPSNRFLPATGTLLKVVEPQAPGIRIDSSVRSGDEIGVHYDPLIAKVIALAESRGAAIKRMQSALREYVLLGVTTNLEFLQDILTHPQFQSGAATTALVESKFSNWGQRREEAPVPVLIAAALAKTLTGNAHGSHITAANDPFSPWTARDGWRAGQVR